MPYFSPFNFLRNFLKSRKIISLNNKPTIRSFWSNYTQLLEKYG